MHYAQLPAAVEGVSLGKSIATGPQVAIITATRNRLQHLHRCVESVAAQTYANIEHIIVDDRSTDGTWKFLQEINGQGKARCFRLDASGKGGARGRNFGIRQTQAEFIAYLDDDDIFYTDHVATLVQHFIKHKCQFAYCAAHKTEDGKHITGVWSTPIWDEDIRAVNMFPICAVMHSKKIWVSVGGMDETLGVYEDWDLWQRLIHHGHVPCFVNRVTSVVDSSSVDSIQHVESSERKREVGEIIKTKIGYRVADYHTYLKSRAEIRNCVIPKRMKVPTHRETLKKISRAPIPLKKAPFWKVINRLVK